MDEALMRLECLKLACARAAMPVDAVRVAGEFETYVKGPAKAQEPAAPRETLTLRKPDKPAR